MEIKNLRFVKFIQLNLEKLIYSIPIYVNNQASLINLYNAFVNENKISLKDQSVFESLQQEYIDLDQIYRIGSTLDGGYVMYKVGNEKKAISIGVGRDVSWDLAISKLGIMVHMFDHTVARPPTKFTNSKFHKIGIRSSKTKPSNRLLEFEGILQKAGCEELENLILKIDIEGGEWEILEEIESKFLEKFNQIIIEFHDVDLDDPIKKNVLEKIRLSHSIIHINPNNYSKIISFEGYLYPSILEVTYVKNKLLHNTDVKTFSSKTYKNDPRVPSFSNKIFRAK
jgi:hypothetical protein